MKSLQGIAHVSQAPTEPVQVTRSGAVVVTAMVQDDAAGYRCRSVNSLQGIAHVSQAPTGWSFR